MENLLWLIMERHSLEKYCSLPIAVVCWTGSTTVNSELQSQGEQLHNGDSFREVSQD
jgi:hypothetical protein